MTDIIRLADGHASVVGLLTRMQKDHPDRFAQLVIDLDDMQMTSYQIWEAYNWCEREDLDFVEMCAKRTRYMVEYVNSHCKDKVAREHGEQQTIPTIDGAVKDILEKAEAEGKLQRLDEGAEHINNFFIAMLTAMQASSKFTTNVRINLNTGNGEWGVFAVSLVELLNRDGTPFAAQPQNEVQRQQEMQLADSGVVKDTSGIFDVLENSSGK